MKSMPKDGRRDLVQKGLEEGGLGAFEKLLLPRGWRGIQFSYVIILGGEGKVLIHHTFLKTHARLTWAEIS